MEMSKCISTKSNFSFVLWVLGCQRFGVKWINLAQNRIHQGSRMTTVMNSPRLYNIQDLFRRSVMPSDEFNYICNLLVPL